MMMRRAIGALALIVATCGPAAAQEPLRVGFRADAPPFSAESAEKPGTYEGFLVDLCHKILKGLPIEEVRVTADDRFDQLSKGGANGGVDMLCDPTSAQPKVIDAFLVSPLVFATGVGYLRRAPETRESNDVVIGFLDGTTSRVAVDIAVDRGAVKALQDGEIIRRPARTHDDGLDRLCAGEFEFYFGDLDILRSLLHRREESCDGVTNSGATTFSYEPYVLAVNADRPDLAVRVQSRLYRMFSDGTAQGLYKTHFGADRPKSDALQAVFALNGVLPCIDLVDENPCETTPD